jgi:hypothetical protein
VSGEYTSMVKDLQARLNKLNGIYTKLDLVIDNQHRLARLVQLTWRNCQGTFEVEAQRAEINQLVKEVFET